MLRSLQIFFFSLVIIYCLPAISVTTNSNINVQLNKLEQDVEDWIMLKEKTAILDPQTLKAIPPKMPVLPNKISSTAQIDKIRAIKQLIKKGDLFFKKGQYNNAKEEYLSALEINANDSNIISKAAKCELAMESMIKASDLFNIGEYQNALINYQQILVINPDDLNAKSKIELAKKLIGYEATARREIDKSEYPSALAWYGKVKSLNAGNSRIDNQLNLVKTIISKRSEASKLFFQGDYQSVINISNLILSHNAKDTMIAQLLKKVRDIITLQTNALQEFNSGNYQQALNYINKALAINPTDKSLKEQLSIVNQATNYQSDAQLYKELGETKRLIKTLSKIQEINSGNDNLRKDILTYETVLKNKQDVFDYFQDEDYETAILQLQKILEVNPKDIKAKEFLSVCKEAIRLRDLGTSLFAMNKYSEAEKAFIELRELLIFDEKISTKILDQTISGKQVRVEVSVSSKVSSPAKDASVTIFGIKKILAKQGKDLFKGDFVLPRTIAPGEYAVKTRVILADKTLLTRFTDIKLERETPKASPVPKLKPIDYEKPVIKATPVLKKMPIELKKPVVKETPIIIKKTTIKESSKPIEKRSENADGEDWLF